MPFIPAADEAQTASALNKTRMDTNDLTTDALLLLRDQIPGLKTYLSSDDDVISDLEYKGAALVAKSPIIYHYEGGSLFDPVVIAAAVGTPTATSAVVTLNAAAYNQHGTDYLTSITEGDKVLVINPTSNAMAQALVVKANHLSADPTFGGLSAADGVYPAHMEEGNYALQFNATPANARQFTLSFISGTALNASGFLAAGTILSSFSGTFPEGGYGPREGKLWDFTKFNANFEIVDAYHAETGRAANSASYSFEVKGKTRVWDVQKLMTAQLCRYREGFNLFHSEQGTPTYQGKTMTTMRGLYPTVKARGNRFTYTLGSTFLPADVLALTLAMSKNNAAKSYTLYGGVDLIANLEAAVRTFGTGGSIIYGNLGNGDMVVKLGMKGVSVNGISLFWKVSGAFMHKQTFGLSALMQGSGVIVPNANVQGQDSDGTPWDNQALQVRYIERDGQRYKEVATGFETQRRDVKGYDIFTEVALQVSGAREFYTIEATA